MSKTDDTTAFDNATIPGRESSTAFRGAASSSDANGLLRGATVQLGNQHYASEGLENGQRCIFIDYERSFQSTGSRETDSTSPVWTLGRNNIVQNGTMIQGSVQMPSQASVRLQDPEQLLRQAHEAYRLGNYPLALQNCQPVPLFHETV